MACLSSSERSAILAQIETKREQLEIANNTFRQLLSNQNQEYRFNSGEGSQRATRVKIKDMQDVISAIESEIDALLRRLCSGGVKALRLRRNAYYPAWYR
jgi:hypothetical protein